VSSGRHSVRRPPRFQLWAQSPGLQCRRAAGRSRQANRRKTTACEEERDRGLTKLQAGPADEEQDIAAPLAPAPVAPERIRSGVGGLSSQPRSSPAARGRRSRRADQHGLDLVVAQHLPAQQAAAGQRRDLAMLLERRHRHQCVVGPSMAAIGLPPACPRSRSAGPRRMPNWKIRREGARRGMQITRLCRMPSLELDLP